jgi:hypothetical protein
MTMQVKRSAVLRWALTLGLMLVAPVAAALLYATAFEGLGWRSEAAFWWACALALGIGLVGVVRLPITWPWRILTAVAYAPLMSVTLACWALMFACYVLHDCL